MIIKEDYFAHYGTLHESGRYPWGSGDNPHQRNKRLIDNIAEFHKQGLTDTEIAKGLGMKRSQLQAMKSIAKNEQKQADIGMAMRLKEKGLSNVEIGKRMGAPGMPINESSVRALIDPGTKLKADMLMATANRLKDAVDKKGFIDVGAGVEHHVGVSRDSLDTAIAVLKEKGYAVEVVQQDQLGTIQKTYTKVIAPPGTVYSDVAANKDKIQSFTDTTDDGGLTWSGIQPPISVDSSRIKVAYGKDGGAENDGVIFVRPGIDELSLGADHYAQVRIAVDGSHYLKGMGMYKTGLPKGVDLQFNTPKTSTGNNLDAMKPLRKDNNGNVDQANPFGSLIRQLPKIDANGREIPNTVRSAMNIVNTEGRWAEWSKNLSPQMLSKQSPALAKTQLDKAYQQKKQDLDDISALTNAGVRIKLLEAYAKSADSSSVHLKAAHLPRQSTHVILPIASMKDTEIYAPTFRNGERVVLIRFPHAGIFEIPELIVNNNNPEAKKLLGEHPVDSVGINAKVAEHLSGADFDGDTVLVIPNNNDLIKTAPALERLKNFNAKVEYRGYEGMPRMTSENKGLQMGDVSNLITDMTLKGASFQELSQAARHAMVVIDAENHNLNYKQSAKDNGIANLKTKYQVGPKGGPGGASTLISARKGRLYVPEYRAGRAKEGGPIDKKTGKLILVPTKRSYPETTVSIDPATGNKVYTETGKIILNRTRTTKLAWTSDARTLSSGTKMENIYADHSNKLKALANAARKEMVNTKTPPMSDSAKSVYSNEVTSLNAKLRLAQRNSPLERQAQRFAASAIVSIKASNRDMDKADIKKMSFLALETARLKTGAKKQAIELTDREWEAIQAGAISNHKLTQILNNANLEQIKLLATPRTHLVMTPSKTSKAIGLLASGKTQAEVADILGVSVTTLMTTLKGVG